MGAPDLRAGWFFTDDDHTYAGGNPNSQVVPTDPLAGLDHIAREVQAAGIREITGEVIIDDRLFSPAQSTGSGPRKVSPIVINDNVIDVLAQPAVQGRRAGAGHFPAGNTVRDDGRAGGDSRRRHVARAGGPTRPARDGLPYVAGCLWAILAS